MLQPGQVEYLISNVHILIRLSWIGNTAFSNMEDCIVMGIQTMASHALLPPWDSTRCHVAHKGTLSKCLPFCCLVRVRQSVEGKLSGVGLWALHGHHVHVVITDDAV